MNTLIQISRTRYKGFLSARRIRAIDGVTIKSERPLSVKFPEAYNDAAQVGSIWRINDGEETVNQFKAANGITIYEDHIDATDVEYVKPNTRLMETWLRRNIDGIGEVKAKQIARIELLEKAVLAGDPTNLIKLHDVAKEQLLRKFPRDEYAAALHWLASRNLPVKLANSIAEAWREDTIKLLEDNPFRLLQFDVPWTRCCEVAKEFGYTASSEKYKAGLATHIISKYCKETNSTVMPRKAFASKCAARRIDMDQHINAGMSLEFLTYVKAVDAFQLEGQFLLESILGNRLRNALFRSPGDLSELAGWEAEITDKAIVKALHEFEQTIPFSLTEEQRNAVLRSVKSNVISLSGGAGTGKTTILNAILSVIETLAQVTFDQNNVKIVQVALSGRAAQRMSEATGRPASTIAKYCIDQKNTADDKRPDHVVCVIDEASMVDIYSMSNLIDYLPLATRFIFVGDVYQLPPVSGGLVFHELMESDFAKVALTQVKRQGEESGIHKFATAVRNEVEDIKLPLYETDNSVDCSIVKSIDPEVISELFDSHGGSKRSVVLTSMNDGAAGVHNLNKVMQAKMGYDRPVVTQDTEDGLIVWKSFANNNFFLNDPILITKNDYTIGVRNGDLGTITQVNEVPEVGCYGILTIGDRDIEITEDLLYKMDHGFAVTIHKSQGSQWENVILVLDRAAENMLDKTLLYTGATRAQKKLIICCEDEALIDDAVARGSIASQRHTNLLHHLNNDF